MTSYQCWTSGFDYLHHGISQQERLEARPRGEKGGVCRLIIKKKINYFSINLKRKESIWCSQRLNWLRSIKKFRYCEKATKFEKNSNIFLKLFITLKQNNLH